MIKRKIKIILIIIVCMIISGAISAYAAISASIITYQKSEDEEISVEDALNELYNKQLNSTLVANGIYGANPNNPNVTVNYTFQEKGLAVVNLGTRSAGSSTGTTSYQIKIDNVLVDSYSGANWFYLKSLQYQVEAGQSISVYVHDTASSAAAFAFINFVK